MHELSGKRVLVTGGTGFIGGRLIERLVLECGAQVRVLLRNFSRATRIARFDLEMLKVDLTDAEAVKKAAEGCDVVLHCACGTDGSELNQRSITFDGTVNILNAARQAGAQRVVHISTINVYGPLADGDLDETTPRRYAGDVYSDSKLDAEKAALDQHAQHGLPVVVLQPTIVFGPFGPAWTMRIFNELSSGRVILVNGGNGLCNAVYVDDVVSAILLAAVRQEAVGEAFLISGPEPVTWREFYGAHEGILGHDSHVEMSEPEAQAFFKEQMRPKGLLSESLKMLREEVPLRRRVRGTREVDALFRAAKRVVPGSLRQAIKRKLTSNDEAAPAPVATAVAEELPILPMPPGAIQLQASKTRVRIDKAKRLLGYEPAFDFAAGMERVGTWARWANLVPDEPAGT